MLFNTDYRDVNKAEMLTRMIGVLRGPNAQDVLRQMLFDDTGNDFTCKFVYQTANMPTYFFAGGTLGQLILVDGARSNSLAATLMSGYLAAATLRGPNASNLELGRMRDTISADMSATLTQRGPINIWCGFSMGGAVATLLGGEFNDHNHADNQQIITFGAVRPSVSEFADSVRNMHIVRYMRDTDWVPLIPPHASLFLGGYVLPGGPQQRAFNRFVQPHGGIVINTGGALLPSLLPNAAVLPSVSDFSASIFTQVDNVWSEHGILKYNEDLNKALSLLPGRPIDVRPESRVEPRTVISATAERRAFIQQDAAMMRQGEIQMNGGEAIPRPRLFRAVKQRRVWWVYFGDKPVFAAPRKKRALSICRDFNSALRKLQRQGYVDASTFASQWVDYLNAASDPTSGFVPQLQTMLPS
jgi:pimeloyl-ACP methyl ester carboxylesterase